jgi:hypothetical protein
MMSAYQIKNISEWELASCKDAELLFDQHFHPHPDNQAMNTHVVRSKFSETLENLDF